MENTQNAFFNYVQIKGLLCARIFLCFFEKNEFFEIFEKFDDDCDDDVDDDNYNNLQLDQLKMENGLVLVRIGVGK